MIRLDNYEDKEFVLSFLQALREKQKNNPDYLVSCKVKLYSAFDLDLRIISFLVHPLAIQIVNFFDESSILETKQEILDLMKEVIIYETSSTLKQICLSTEDLNLLISKYRKLNNPITIEAPPVKTIPNLSERFS